MTRRQSVAHTEIPAGFALAKPLSAERITVPASVELEGGDLVWKMLDGKQKADRRYPGSGLIWQFVELADQGVSDERIRAFAKSWGLLWVCEHGEPNFHPRYDEPEGALVFCHGPAEMPFLSGREPVAAWRKIARRLGTVLALAGDVAAGRLGDPEDWELAGVPSASIQSWHGQLGVLSRHVVHSGPPVE